MKQLQIWFKRGDSGSTFFAPRLWQICLHSFGHVLCSLDDNWGRRGSRGLLWVYASFFDEGGWVFLEKPFSTLVGFWSTFFWRTLLAMKLARHTQTFIYNMFFWFFLFVNVMFIFVWILPQTLFCTIMERCILFELKTWQLWSFINLFYCLDLGFPKHLVAAIVFCWMFLLNGWNLQEFDLK